MLTDLSHAPDLVLIHTTMLVKGYNKISSGLKVTIRQTVVLNGKVKNTESVTLKDPIPVTFF